MGRTRGERRGSRRRPHWQPPGQASWGAGRLQCTTMFRAREDPGRQVGQISWWSRLLFTRRARVKGQQCQATGEVVTTTFFAPHKDSVSIREVKTTLQEISCSKGQKK